MGKDILVMRLEALAAQAKVTADDVKAGNLWPGQLANRVQQMEEFLSIIRSHHQVMNDR